jgi:hypothetical protein
MFNTTQPLDLGGGARATQAFIVVHYTPYVQGGKVCDNILFRAQRVRIGEDGTATAMGPYLDKAFTPAQLTAARAATPALDSALTALTTALEALAPQLGL